MQSKQNLCVHPLIVATSVMEVGVSRQITHVSSVNGRGVGEVLLVVEPGSFAAGFIYLLAMASSSSSSTMGDSLVLFPTRGSMVPEDDVGCRLSARHLKIIG